MESFISKLDSEFEKFNSLRKDFPGGHGNVYFEQITIAVAQGLLASQTETFKYIDTPEKKKEDLFVDDVLKFSWALTKRIKHL